MKKILLGMLTILLVFTVKVNYSHAETVVKASNDNVDGISYAITYESDKPEEWTLTINPGESTVIKDYNDITDTPWYT